MRRWWAVWMMVCAFPLAAWGLELKSTGGGALTFQDETTPVGSFRSVNCEGDGIACANVSGILTITGVTATGCAAGELMHIRIQRDSGHASDNFAGTARLIGVELTMRRAQ